jgi:hypothetical protein
MSSVGSVTRTDTHTDTHTHIGVEKQWQGLLKRDQFIRSVSGQEPYQQM